MKKILLFVLVNNLTLISAPVILPNPIIPTAKLPSPVKTPPVGPVAKLPTRPPLPPVITPTAKPFPQPQIIPVNRPIMPSPAPIIIAPPTAQPVLTKPITTPAPTSTSTTDLPSIVIHNISTQTATLTNPIATINSKSTSIAIAKPITINKGKHEIHLSIQTPLHTASNFGGFTSITINGTPLSIIHPKTKANYFGNSTIYIDNVNGQWKMVPKPNKNSALNKSSSSKKTAPKQTLIKPVAKAALNLQANAKTPKSYATKTAQNIVVPPMPQEPKLIPAKQ